MIERGRLAALEIYGTASGAGRAVVARLGATPIDYRQEDFVRRVRELTGDGVDIVLDGIGGRTSLRSYQALRRGGRLVLFGHYSTLVGGRRSATRVVEFYLSGALMLLANFFPGGKRVRTYRIAKLRDRHPDWFHQDLIALFGLLAEGKIKPLIAERIPLLEARRAHALLGRGGVQGKLVLICST